MTDVEIKVVSLLEDIAHTLTNIEALLSPEPEEVDETEEAKPEEPAPAAAAPGVSGMGNAEAAAGSSTPAA